MKEKEEKNVQVGEENLEFEKEDESSADAAGGELEDGSSVGIMESDGEEVAESGAGGYVDAKLVDPEYTRRMPFSVLAALLGAIFGLIPATLCAYFFETAFYPFFVAAPLLSYLLNKLFKGGRDIRTFFIIALLSFVSAYVTAQACQVARIVSFFSMSILRIPAFTIEAFVESVVLTDSFSAYLYPLLFTVLGIAVTWEFLRKPAQSPAIEELSQVSGEPEGGNKSGIKTEVEVEVEAGTEVETDADTEVEIGPETADEELSD